MTGKKRGSSIWCHHIQALVDQEVNAAMRAYALEQHKGSISTAARTALKDHLTRLGYLAKDKEA
jgi:hypothetical protein